MRDSGYGLAYLITGGRGIPCRPNQAATILVIYIFYHIILV